ncbi:MAG: flagellar protein FlaG [Gammaproteobacteria bacterium]
MTTEIDTSDIRAFSDRRVTAIDKIDRVKAVQELPDGGKQLPPEKPKVADTAENLDQAADLMNSRAQTVHRQLQFSIDENSGRTVITVLNSETQEVIRQIPEEEALYLASKLVQGGDLEIFDTFA